MSMLTMVDNALAVTECGYETDRMNSYLNMELANALKCIWADLATKVYAMIFLAMV